jgi:amino acid permease
LEWRSFFVQATQEITMNSKKTEVKVTLSRDLSAFDITMIGVGAMIGAGIFVLTGHAAGAAGPAFLVAFLDSSEDGWTGSPIRWLVVSTPWVLALTPLTSSIAVG